MIHLDTSVLVAALWTLNRDDFKDIPDLTLYDPDAPDDTQSHRHD